MPLSRAARNKIRQTRLEFSALPSSSPAKDRYPNAVHDRLANIRYAVSRQVSKSSPTNQPGNQESLPTPEPSSQALRESPETASSPLSEPPTTPDAAPIQIEEDENEGEDDLPLPSSNRRKSRRSAIPKLAFTPTSSRRSTRLQGQPVRRDRGSLTSSQTSASIDIGNSPKQLSALGSPETSGDEEAILETRPSVRRRPTKPVRKDDFVVDDDEVEYICSDEAGKQTESGATPKRARPERDDFVVDNDIVEFLTSDEDSATPSKSRKLSRSHKSPRTPRQRSRREQEEIDEDLADLQDSEEAEDSAKRSRTRGGPVTTQRDKAKHYLDLLKRRRAGERVPRVEDSDEEEAEEDGVNLDMVGGDFDTYAISHDGSVHSSVDTDVEPSNNEDEAEDDFVENDSPSRGRLPHPDIPLEFTSYASAKPRELFPHIIEWLVKNKIAPAFSRHDQLYKLAFDRVDDQVTAQAGSRLISAAWGEEFKHAVLARPHVRVAPLPDMGMEDWRNCDACNRTNHPAQYDFVFSGHAYNKDDLEPVENDSEDEDDNDDIDGISHDEAGHVLASQSQHFYLGRFCAANAEMGHKLTHWKFHLNDNLLSYLESQGILSPAAIIAREKLNKKKREKEAEAIVDSMEATGMIGELWKDFQNDLEDARLGMEGYDRKGGRGNRRVGTVRSVRDSEGVVREWTRDKRNGRQVENVVRLESDSEGD